jgi:acyl-coenzyme A thioesterase PaaI-like protein
VALAEALRRLVALAVTCDAPAEELRRAADALAEVAARLEARSRGGTVRQPLPDREASPEQSFPTSPVTGPANPLAPPARFWVEDEGRVRGEVVLGAPYEGPPGCVHGGVLALVLDEVLGAANFAARAPGMTAALTVRYRRPTPLDAPLELSASFERRSGRRILTRGAVLLAGTPTAEAEGVFVEVGRERFEQLARRGGAVRSSPFTRP